MNNIFKEILEIRRTGGECVLITLIEKKGHGPSEAGRKMVLSRDGNISGTIGGGSLEKLALAEAEKVMKKKKSSLKRYILDTGKAVAESEKTGMLCGGEVLLFTEYLGPEEKVFLFGAGHIGKAICPVLKGLDFQITVLDSRESELNIINVEEKILLNDIPAFFENTTISKESYVIIATHSHEVDYRIFREMVTRRVKTKYTGLIASAKKIESIKKRLKKDVSGSIDLSRLYSPAGLDLGGRSPGEIALSVAAEIQAIKYGKKEIKNLSTGK